jgi:ABC-2 type transport system ATP-binding protein
MLSVKGLSKSYAGKPALENVSFDVNPGEVVALLGANGSGKTTTINAICRLIEWESGEISINGESTKKNFTFQRKIGAVLGGCRNTNWRLTPIQNARYFARLRGFSGSDVEQRIDALHTALGLDQHLGKEVMKLSTGNKQKAALLCALGYQPDYVLLDEPTLGLDFETVNQLQQTIDKQAAEMQQSFLITSHDLGFIDKICSRVIVLDHGKLLFDGPIQALKDKLLAYELVLSMKEKVDYHGLVEAHWQGRFNHQVEENELRIQFESSEQSLAMIHHLHQQKLSPEVLTINPLTAEQAYQAIVQQKDAS